MKKIVNITYILLATVLYTGCYDDLGNYEYATLPEMSIKLEEQYTTFIGDEFVVEPEFSKYILDNQDDFSYEWLVKGEVISTEKNCNAIIGLTPKLYQYSALRITENSTDRVAYTTFNLQVESQFKNGWMILGEKDGKSCLNYLRSDNKYYQNLYKAINNEDLPGSPGQINEHWFSWSSLLGQIFISFNESPYYVELDGSSFNKMATAETEFVGAVPENLNPYYAYSVDKLDYLVSENGIYTRPNDSYNSAYQSYKYPSYKLPGDYKLSRKNTRGDIVFGNEIVAFDEKSDSYLMMDTRGILSEMNTSYDTEPVFSPNDMDAEILGINYAGAKGWSGYYVVGLVREKGSGQIKVQRFSLSGWGLKTFMSESENILPGQDQLSANAQFEVCRNRPYVYITSGSKLFRYNHIENTQPVEVKDFGAGSEIQAFSIDLSGMVGGVILKTGSVCDFMTLDLEIANEGNVLFHQENVLDQGVSVFYKVGDLWDYY